MVARNFLETDANILYPRIDNTNGGTGIVGMEFPSMNYIYFLIAKVFGYTHWYGRLINLIISSLGLLFFYKLICLAGFSKKHAFTSTILLAASIWFSFSRKMMPDTYCISLMFIALYYGIRYLKEGKLYQIALYVAVGSLAILSKIPAGIFLVLLIPFLLKNDILLKNKLILSLLTVIPLLLTCFWYFVWDPRLAEEFGHWYNSGKPLARGFHEIISHPGETLHNFYFSSFYSYILFTLFIAGFVLMFIKKDKKMIIAFFLPFFVFLIYMFRSGYYFYHHNYYIIPFVPVMALVAGYAATFIRKQWVYVSLLVLGTGESIANQHQDFFIRRSETYKLSIEKVMDQVSTRDDLILINGNGNPQLIYFSHRKGWNCHDEELSDTVFLRQVIAKKCKFIVVDKHTGAKVAGLRGLDQVFENENFLICKTENECRVLE